MAASAAAKQKKREWHAWGMTYTNECEVQENQPRIVRRERNTNHNSYIDLTSHNIRFTTLNISIKDESAYAYNECQLRPIPLSRGVLRPSTAVCCHTNVCSYASTYSSSHSH